MAQHSDVGRDDRFHSDGSEANYTYSSAWFDAISPPPNRARAITVATGRRDELPTSWQESLKSMRHSDDVPTSPQRTDEQAHVEHYR